MLLNQSAAFPTGLLILHEISFIFFQRKWSTDIPASMSHKGINMVMLEC